MNCSSFKILRCPETGSELLRVGDYLHSTLGGHRYPIVDGIPCLIAKSLVPTHSGYQQLLQNNSNHLGTREPIDKKAIASYLRGMIVPTCGNLYRGSKLTRYPIPPFPPGLESCKTLLDLGCNWGRWSISAARAGHEVLGVDIHLESLRMAKAIAEELEIEPRPQFVLADARALPFSDSSLDGAFSYSVIQHFSKTHGRQILTQIGRVLRADGISLIQMPNILGMRSMLTMARRGFGEGEGFDVRYYRIEELMNIFQETIGSSSWSVDCFLGLNVHSWDQDLMCRTAKLVTRVADFLKRSANVIKPVNRLADSVYVRSVKRACPANGGDETSRSDHARA